MLSIAPSIDPIPGVMKGVGEAGLLCSGVLLINFFAAADLSYRRWLVLLAYIACLYCLLISLA